MFHNLVESRKNSENGKRKAWFFAGTATVWTLLLGVAAVAGVVLYDAQLTASASSVMLAFPLPPAPPLAKGNHEIGKTSANSTAAQPREFAPPKDEPTQLTEAKELPTLPNNSGSDKGEGVVLGDPNGVNGGVLGGSPEGIIGGGGPGDVAPPPPPGPAKPAEEVTPVTNIRRSEGVIRGNALSRAVPDYPPLAKAGHISGDVVVEITISEDGQVISARCVNGHALLQGAALSAARQWKFRPTLLNNTPVKVTGLLTFRFTM